MEEEKLLLGRVSSEDDLSVAEQTLLKVIREKKLAAQSGMDAYDRHMKQYSKCKSCVHKIEDGLKVGECVVYQDFVAQYMFGSDRLGDKMNNLQLVLIWRESEQGPLQSFKVANFCSDKKTMANDSFFTADVYHFHLQGVANSGSGLLDHFDTLYLVGDHGPHFTSKQVIYHDSVLQTKHQKKIVPLFLCSHHAFSRADGAGAEPKRLALSAARDRAWWNLAQDYANGITKSEYRNSIGYFFPQINRSANVFPPESGIAGDKLRLREKCEFTFVTGQVGVVFYRVVPGEGSFQVLDMVKRKKKRSCYFVRPLFYSATRCSAPQW